MDLSLRDVVRTRYGITGSFSVINDVLSKVKKAVSEEDYRNADGSISLRLILSSPIPPVILSFTVSRTRATQSNPAVTLSWHVEPPTPWLMRNTYTACLALQGPPPDGILRWQQVHLPLIGTLTDNAESPATFYQLVAEVIMPGGTATAKALVMVQVDPSGGGTGGPQTTTYGFFLSRQQVFEGPIPYAGVFGQGINGHLDQITNPNGFRIGLVLPGHTTKECFSDPKAAIVLGPNAGTTSQNIMALYGASHPALPISILSCIEAGSVVLDWVQVNITYTYMS